MIKYLLIALLPLGLIGCTEDNPQPRFYNGATNQVETVPYAPDAQPRPGVGYYPTAQPAPGTQLDADGFPVGS